MEKPAADVAIGADDPLIYEYHDMGALKTSGDVAYGASIAYPGHAGHDCGTIESRGFRELTVEREGRPTLVDNPRWGD